MTCDEKANRKWCPSASNMTVKHKYEVNKHLCQIFVISHQCSAREKSLWRGDEGCSVLSVPLLSLLLAKEFLEDRFVAWPRQAGVVPQRRVQRALQPTAIRRSQWPLCSVADRWLVSNEESYRVIRAAVLASAWGGQSHRFDSLICSWRKRTQG